MMSKSKPQATCLPRAPMSKAKPKSISSAHKKIANESASPFRKVRWKTSKYSSNLYEKPSGSLALINPEKINSKPTAILQNQTKFFFISTIILSLRKRHSSLYLDNLPLYLQKLLFCRRCLQSVLHALISLESNP